MEYLFKGVVGAAVVILIAFLAKSRYFYLAGLAPLFPTFALFAHLLSYRESGVHGLKVVACFGLFSILPYAVYLLSILFFIDRLSLFSTLALALVSWLLTAVGIIFIWNHFGPFKAIV